jgi:hypothetical protein
MQCGHREKCNQPAFQRWLNICWRVVIVNARTGESWSCTGILQMISAPASSQHNLMLATTGAHHDSMAVCIFGY